MDLEAQHAFYSNPFSDKVIRLGFLRKVFGILFVQLLITGGITVPFFFVEPLKEYVYHNPWFLITCGIMSLVLLIGLSCSTDCRRNTPCNFITLFVFTVLEGLTLGAITSFYKVDHVLIAFGILAILVLALILFACQTKIDFTPSYTMMVVILLVFFIFGLLAFFFQSRILALVYSCIGALIFSVFIVIDIQIMLGGNRMYSISPEEYVFAALNLYLDIIYLFLYLLRIISFSDN